MRRVAHLVLFNPPQPCIPTASAGSTRYGMSPERLPRKRKHNLHEALGCGVRPVQNNPIDLSRRPKWNIAKTVIGMLFISIIDCVSFFLVTFSVIVVSLR